MENEYLIETSPSNHARCRECDNKIDKGIKRVSRYMGNRYGHAGFRFYHLECILPTIEDEMIEIQKLIRDIKIELRGRKNE